MADLRQRPGDQPLPVPNDGPSMHDLVTHDLERSYPRAAALGFVHQDIAGRKELGLARYGSLLQAHNGRDALRDLYEELLDASVYARQKITESVAAGLLNPGLNGVYQSILRDLLRIRSKPREAVMTIETADIDWPPGPWAIDTAPALVGGATAVFSQDRRYRYALTRTWGPGPRVVWIMLNPSTADATIDDATLRRVTGFTRWWDYGGLAVVNLFALRSTDPAGLVGHPDPVGPDNDAFIRAAVHACDLVVAAWGAFGDHLDRDLEMRPLLAGRLVTCLGRTADGQPRHPVRLAADTQLDHYTIREASANA